MANNVDKDKLARLRDTLPYGSQKKIAEQTGLSVKTVYNILQGFSHNEKVILLATKMAEDDRNRRRTLEESVNRAIA